MNDVERMNVLTEEKANKKSIVAKSYAKEIALTGMFIALTLVFTAFVNITLPFGYGGLIHLGNIPLLLAAMLYGKRTGAITGAVGMALFDILSSWISWAPCTFITCGLIGLVVGWITERHTEYRYKVLAVAFALVIKLTGYYVFEAVVYHSFITPLASFLGNTLQILIAAVPVLILITPLEKMLNKAGLRG